MAQPVRPPQLGVADDRALGTALRVVVTDPATLVAAKAAVDAVVAGIDLACSRFRDDSELVRLNRRAGEEVQLSPLLARALGEGLRAARITDGDVDPTVGTAMRLSGYDVDFDSVPRDGGPITLRVTAVPGWRTVRFTETTRSVVCPPGVEIDLGATAKALAADLAAEAAQQVAGDPVGVLVALGGDIAMAGPAPPGGWAVQVSDDSNDALDPDAERIALRGGGVASSSTRVRRWRRGSVELHHIIDPRTGCPVETPWRLVTVVADSCVDANIASTAAIIRGVRAVEWLRTQRLPSRLVTNDGDVVRLAGWPQPD